MTQFFFSVFGTLICVINYSELERFLNYHLASFSRSKLPLFGLKKCPKDERPKSHLMWLVTSVDLTNANTFYTPGISMHVFPLDSILRAKWVKFVQRHRVDCYSFVSSFRIWSEFSMCE